MTLDIFVPFVKNIVTYYYALPLKAFPTSAFFSNNCSAFKHPSFVEEAIEELLNKRCIEQHDTPHVVNPLIVAEGKKLRFVLDLHYVNNFLKSKYENLRTLSEIFESGFFFFTFDLESGYDHVRIVKHQQLLGFSWLFSDRKRKYFPFRVLPFGLSTAWYVFTKLLRPFVARLRYKIGSCFSCLYRRWDIGQIGQWLGYIIKSECQ